MAKMYLLEQQQQQQQQQPQQQQHPAPPPQRKGEDCPPPIRFPRDDPNGPPPRQDTRTASEEDVCGFGQLSAADAEVLRNNEDFIAELMAKELGEHAAGQQAVPPPPGPATGPTPMELSTLEPIPRQQLTAPMHPTMAEVVKSAQTQTPPPPSTSNYMGGIRRAPQQGGNRRNISANTVMSVGGGGAHGGRVLNFSNFMTGAVTSENFRDLPATEPKAEFGENKFRVYRQSKEFTNFTGASKRYDVLRIEKDYYSSAGGNGEELRQFRFEIPAKYLHEFFAALITIVVTFKEPPQLAVMAYTHLEQMTAAFDVQQRRCEAEADEQRRRMAAMGGPSAAVGR